MDRRVPRHDVSALRRAHDLGIAIIERHPLQRSFVQNFHIAAILARHRKQSVASLNRAYLGRIASEVAGDLGQRSIVRFSDYLQGLGSE